METEQKLPQQTINAFVGVSHGDVASVRAMLAEHPQLAHVTATWGETSIEAASQMANREIIDMLLAQGAPLDICTAAVLGDAERVQAMLDDDPNLRDATGAHGIGVMYFPIVGNHLDIAKMLLESGSSLNAGAGSGNTALHGAALFGNVEGARWLLKNGADASALDFEGKTALQVAEASGHEAVANVLREHGA